MSFAFKSAAPAARSLYRPLPNLPSTSASAAARSLHLSASLQAPKKAVSSKKVATTKHKKPTGPSPNAQTLEEAFLTLRAWEITRPFAAIEAQIHVEPDKNKPSMRGRTLFPKDPSTKPSIIYVYCESAKVKEALAAGATQAGGEELLDKVVKGTVPLPTACLATPAFNPIMLENKTLTRYLGPKGLLPQAKRGTVVDDIATAVKGLKGALDWRVSKQMRLAAAVARPNFTIEEVESNLVTFLRDVRAVGTSANAFDEAGNKPTEISKVVLTSTFGPGIEINDIIPRL